MTTTDTPATAAEPSEPPEPPDPGPTPAASGAGGWRTEVLLLIEVAALAAFAFSRPVLDSFGRSPETFVARGATPATVVLFAVAVVFIPIAVVAVVGIAARLLGTRPRWWVHLALVAAVGSLVAWRLGQDATGWPGSATKLVLLGLAAGPLLAILRAKVPSSSTFFRYAGIASVVFLGQFLFASPTASLIGDDQAGADSEVSRTVSGALGDEPPPIVFIVTDTLPTQALMDGSGNIDAELYPNLAALASTSTWFRNNTTVSGFTNEAVPAMLSGLYPKASTTQQFVVPYPNNLFTLFGDVYDMNVHEPMTRLCPDDLCASGSDGLAPLLGDAVDLWFGGAEAETAKLDIPGLFLDDRYDELSRWIDAQDFSASGRPDLFFYHAMLPHEPWDFLPDGTVYEASDPPVGLYTSGWTESGSDVGWQRLVLQTQATDRLLGQLFDRLRDAGTFDDAMIVVAGDHGQAFMPGEVWRGLSEANAAQVLWTPLLMKAPHQADGVVDDSNVQTIDVLPTIADRLGFELPWDTDGLVAGGPDERDPGIKFVDDVEANTLRAPDGEPRVEVDAQSGFDALLRADATRGTGTDAVWKRTVHGDLVGRDVDDLDIGARSDADMVLVDLERYDDVDTAAPLPLEVNGGTSAPLGTPIVLAVNGTVAAVTESGPSTLRGGFVHALLLPRSLTDGANDVTAYLVDGDVGAEVLHPVVLRSDD
jgi:hypothetical protein